MTDAVVEYKKRDEFSSILVLLFIHLRAQRSVAKLSTHTRARWFRCIRSRGNSSNGRKLGHKRFCRFSIDFRFAPRRSMTLIRYRFVIFFSVDRRSMRGRPDCDKLIERSDDFARSKTIGSIAVCSLCSIKLRINKPCVDGSNRIVSSWVRLQVRHEIVDLYRLTFVARGTVAIFVVAKSVWLYQQIIKIRLTTQAWLINFFLRCVDRWIIYLIRSLAVDTRSIWARIKRKHRIIVLTRQDSVD